MLLQLHYIFCFRNFVRNFCAKFSNNITVTIMSLFFSSLWAGQMGEQFREDIDIIFSDEQSNLKSQVLPIPVLKVE